MKQIRIGSCIPGDKIVEWLPHFKKMGFECVEITHHMTLNGTDLRELAKRVEEVNADIGMRITAVGLYCNPLMYEDHLKSFEHVIDCVHLFGTDLVTGFTGALEGQPVEESIPRFKEVFTELAKRAADKNVRIAFENCSMDGNWKQTTCNLAFNPKAWEMMFDAVPAENLGLEWEPAHQMIQLIDPVAQLKDWVPRIFNIHGKDATIDWDAIQRTGIGGVEPFVYMRTPGFGDTNWRDIFTILHQKGYEGDVTVEGYHDPVYNGEWETTGQLHALRYLNWCRGGDFVPNPWE